MVENNTQEPSMSIDEQQSSSALGIEHLNKPGDARQNQKEEDEEEDDDDETHKRPRSLKEELQVEDLGTCAFLKGTELFAAAGPEYPLLQVNPDGTFITHAPDLPHRRQVDEDIVVRVDEHGRLLNELGELRKLVGMKYNGRQLYFVNERHPENGQSLAAWFDDDWTPHFLYLGDTILSAAMVLRIRNRMIDGELNNFDEISSK